MSVITYIGFGTNLGDRQKNFEKVLVHFQKKGLVVLKVSPFYKSDALTPDGSEQPWYLNTVFQIETDLGVLALLSTLKKIESDMGRVSRKRWSSRIVDLDILFYGDLIYQDKKLRVPHREIVNRAFVLLPLIDLAPDLIHPDYLESVTVLGNRLNDLFRTQRFVFDETLDQDPQMNLLNSRLLCKKRRA